MLRGSGAGVDAAVGTAVGEAVDPGRAVGSGVGREVGRGVGRGVGSGSNIDPLPIAGARDPEVGLSVTVTASRSARTSADRSPDQVMPTTNEHGCYGRSCRRAAATFVVCSYVVCPFVCMMSIVLITALGALKQVFLCFHTFYEFFHAFL